MSPLCPTALNSFSTTFGNRSRLKFVTMRATRIIDPRAGQREGREFRRKDVLEDEKPTGRENLARRDDLLEALLQRS